MNPSLSLRFRTYLFHPSTSPVRVDPFRYFSRSPSCIANLHFNDTDKNLTESWICNSVVSVWLQTIQPGTLKEIRRCRDWFLIFMFRATCKFQLVNNEAEWRAELATNFTPLQLLTKSVIIVCKITEISPLVGTLQVSTYNWWLLRLFRISSNFIRLEQYEIREGTRLSRVTAHRSGDFICPVDAVQILSNVAYHRKFRSTSVRLTSRFADVIAYSGRASWHGTRFGGGSSPPCFKTSLPVSDLVYGLC